jgi:predicted lipoprotein with Yx(FWY)xxD motif
MPTPSTLRRLAALTGAATLAALLGACASAPPAPAQAMDGVLVGSNQMTLYTFDRDAAAPGKSVCNGGCATNWPPLMAGMDTAASGDWSVVTRDDGGRQWAYKGKPLYFWAKDAKLGDRTGDGFNNVWRLARP